MKTSMLKVMTAALASAVVWAAPLQADKIAHPKGGTPGDWWLIGTTHANHTAHHDAILVKGPGDNYRRIK